MEIVSIIKCDNYHKDLVKEAITKSVKLLGGFHKFIRPDERILIKPNLLLAAKPQKAVTTHPVVLEAMIEILSGFTDASRITVADSPGAGIPYTRDNLEKVYSATGTREVARKTGCILNYDTSYRPFALKDGKAIRMIDVISPALEADKIINLCKFKTHNLTSATGAVKNMFGVVPGFSKIGHHLRFTGLEDFSQMLVDIAYCVKPALNIMDGILGMEGEGPGMSGTPREIGMVLASTDPLAMDMVAARLMGLDSKLYPMLRLEGLPAWEQIQIEGEVEEGYVIDGFVLPRAIGRSQLIENRFANRFLMPRVKNLLNPYPVQDRRKCNLCGVCQKVCPQNAIKIKGKKIVFDYNRCTRCFCCSELCPEGAVEIKYKWLADLLLNRAGWAGKVSK
ncbi:MAG: DUF362 domain-containing protein [Actinomycetota bacterium]